MSAFASLVERASSVTETIYVYVRTKDLSPDEDSNAVLQAFYREGNHWSRVSAKGARVVVDRMLDLLRSYPGAKMRGRPHFHNFSGDPIGSIVGWTVVVRFVDANQSYEFWKNAMKTSHGANVVRFTGPGGKLRKPE